MHPHHSHKRVNSLAWFFVPLILKGRKEDNPDQTTIFLYQYPLDLDPTELEELYRRAIIHEVGHVLFDWVMRAPQRFEWGALHNKRRSEGRFINSKAEESLREDFGECFWMYRHNSGKLLRFDEDRYNIIDAVYREVNQ